MIESFKKRERETIENKLEEGGNANLNENANKLDVRNILLRLINVYGGHHY